MVTYRLCAAGAVLLAAGALVAPVPAAKEPAKAEAPDELRDQAFDKYVDVGALAAAVEAQDPAQLADLALKLVEAERTVGRARKGLSAEDAQRLAVRLAAARHDKGTLDRLADAAKTRGDAKLTGYIGFVRKFAEPPRTQDPAMVVAANQVTPEAMTLYKNMLAEVQQARMTADRPTLEQLEQSVNALTELHEKQRAYLSKLIGETRSKLPAKADRETAMLSKLAALSRAAPPAGNSDRDRVKVALKKGWLDIKFTKGGPYRTVAQATAALKQEPLSPPATSQVLATQTGIAVYRHYAPRAPAGQVAYYSYQPFVRWKVAR
jgi:hypothetical protein